MKNKEVSKKYPKHKLYSVAETLFVESGMTCIAISGQLEISQTTLTRWRNTMEWDQQRGALMAAPNIIRKKLTDEVKSISEGNKPSIDSDALSKVSKSLQYFDGKTPLVIKAAVIKDFDNWMSEVDAALAVQFTTYHKQYLAHCAKIDSLK